MFSVSGSAVVIMYRHASDISLYVCIVLLIIIREASLAGTDFDG